MKTKFIQILTLLFLIMFQWSMAQQVITGTVTDADGVPLPGATIVVQGTNEGTTTDFDGNYSIAASQGDVLSVSFVGYTTVSVEVEAGSSIYFKLSESVELEEVVVTGFGIERAAKSLTYQTQKIGSDDLVKVAPTSGASALAGKVAGMQVNIQSNGVNPNTQILLRGLRSISSSNTALIIIDGSIASSGAFDALNPNDIESINVLKGATAAALYGSLASNGAVLVETKKGKIGQDFTVGVTSSFTIEKVAYMPKFQNEYGTGWQGAYDPVENTNWGPRFDGTMRQIGPTFADGTFQEVPYAPVKDNLLDFYDEGQTVQNTVYVSGASDNSTYYLSLGQQKTKGIVPDDEFKKTTFKVNATKQMGDLSLKFTSNYYRANQNVVGDDIGDQDRTLYWFVLNTPANIPLSTYKDWDNPDSYAYADNYFNAYYQNPYWAIGTNRDIDHYSRLISNIEASYKLNDWASLTTRLSINTGNGYGKYWRAEQTYDPVLQPAHSTVSSFVTDSEYSFTTYSSFGALTIERDLMEDVSMTAILGANSVTELSRSSAIAVTNLSIPGFYDISNGTGQPTVSVNESEKRTYGYFADINLGYKDYLFLNASGRYDFTSTLPDGDNSYFYPAIGVSYVLTDAMPDMKNDILSYMKATVSNSTVYNDLGPYLTNETYGQSSGFPFGELNGFFQTGTAVDSGIKKEKINTTEVGLNMNFLNGRFKLDATYYKTSSTDLITFTTPSNASGATSYLTNIGKVEGKGYELLLEGTVLKMNDLSWDVSVNYSSSEQKVISISEGVDEITIASYGGEYGVYAIVGEDFPQIKAASYTRDPQGRIVIDPATGNPIKDVLKNFGKTTPDYILGMNSTINYKNFSLSATMDYRTGHVYYEQGSDAMEFPGVSRHSASAGRQDFVIPNSVIEVSEGVYEPNTNIPVTGGRQDYWTNTYNEIKENYVKDATALKLREISLNYSLPSSLTDTLPIESMRIGLIGRNLFTWLPEENAFSDPEFNNSTGNAIGVGGYFQSPPTKSIGFSVNVEF
jgi:TonB-linked SusC/RagA family outer membrane protein